MWEIVVATIAVIVLVIVFVVLIVSVYKDHKISKEWERIFKKGGRDD